MRGLTLLVCTVALYAQTPQPHSGGLETDWDIAPVLQELGAHASRLLPALDRINARAWVENGASETYAEQVQSGKDQAQALVQAARSLAKNPERLSASIDLLLRIQSLENILTSIEEGIRKYQSPADAQELASLQAANGGNRDRFQKYIVNLAGERELELQVMDKEAQRCRAIVTAPVPKSGKKI